MQSAVAGAGFGGWQAGAVPAVSGIDAGSGGFGGHGGSDRRCVVGFWRASINVIDRGAAAFWSFAAAVRESVRK